MVQGELVHFFSPLTMISTESSGLLPGPETVTTSDPVRGPHSKKIATRAPTTAAAIAPSMGPERRPLNDGTGAAGIAGAGCPMPEGGTGTRLIGRVGAGGGMRGGAIDGPLRPNGGGGNEAPGRLARGGGKDAERPAAGGGGGGRLPSRSDCEPSPSPPRS